MNTETLKNHLKHSNLHWDIFPHTWYEGSFIGNGIYGASLYHNQNNDLIIKLGHTKTFDNRLPTEIEKDPLYLLARLPIGFFTVSSASKAVNCDETLDIFKANANGTVKTESGQYSYSAIAVRNPDIILSEIQSTQENITISFTPFPAVSPRLTHMIDIKDDNRMSRDYASPKASKDFCEEDIYYHVQPYYNGGYFTTAYKIINNNNRIRLFATTQISDNEKDSIIKCKNVLLDFQNNYEKHLIEHFTWWEKFYKKSSITISEIEYEEFYNIQLYKAASSSAPNGRVFDTCGVWISENTAWPAAFWNLNVQLSYSPLYASNHLELAHSLTQEINNGMNDLKNNVPIEYRKDCFAIGRNTGPGLAAPILNPGEPGPNKQHEAGNLTWALFYCMKEYRMSGDKSILSETVYPVLKGAIQYYLYFLFEGKDGRLHLPRTVSPEYNTIIGGDCNYDLSLLRWGLTVMLEICEILNINDEMLPTWKKTLDKLCDYPHDDTEGFYITADTKYDTSHRHYSHLLMFYPLNLLNLDNPDERKLAETSLDFWQSKPEALQGYSQTGAGAMRAYLGDGNKALNHLKKLWKGFILPNTMYMENISPVLETPLAAATTIQEMLLQSYNGTIKIFPAIPDSWQEISFNSLLCEGGFIVSAKANKGKIVELTVSSLLGNKCIISGKIKELADKHEKIIEIEKDKYEFIIAKSETIKLGNFELSDDYLTNNPLSNCYGLNAAHNLLTEKLT